MKLSSCPRCERHIVVEAASCPFCGTRLGTIPDLGYAVRVIALGVALSSCVGGDDQASDYSGADYAGPGDFGTSLPLDTDTSSTSSTSGGSDTEGDDTSSGTSGSSSSSSGAETEGADTSGTAGSGDTTAASGTDSGGVDYAGPGVGGR